MLYDSSFIWKVTWEPKSKHFKLILIAALKAKINLFQNNLRVCQIIQPDLKHIIVGLLSCYGLNQGLTSIEIIANKLIDFLDQLPLIVSILLYLKK